MHKWGSQKSNLGPKPLTSCLKQIPQEMGGKPERPPSLEETYPATM